jgi:tRNA modification GTPase
MIYENNDTIVAISTPSGNGAIAIIRLSGKRAIELANLAFRFIGGKKKLDEQPGNTIHFGRISEGDRLIDEVLLSIFREPHSYSGEDIIEISCHGSLYIQQEILKLFIKYGARMAQAGEFTRRAFLNGKLDLSQAEAVADLISSESGAAHRIALNQMRGGFSEELGNLRTKLLGFISMIELELDFSEEDVQFADRKQLQLLIREIDTKIKKLIKSFASGNALKTGIPVVIAGPPNVGKSTLLNTLLNEEKAIVSEIPGTTRDAIEDLIHIDGYQFRLTDTAGLRRTTELIETIGIRKTRERMNTAQIILLVSDITSSDEELKGEIDVLLKQNKKKLIIVANKCDQLTQSLLTDKLNEMKMKTGSDVVPISAKTGQNIETLKSLLVESVKDELAEASVTITNARHYEALVRAEDAIARVSSGLASGISSDFLAQDIREVMHYLGEITGQITNDEILGNIFKNFCIGK